MASIVRPTLLRQSCLKVATKKAFSTKPSPTFPAINKPLSSVVSKDAVRSRFMKEAVPSSMRVAAFHATGRRPILPPLPQSVNGTANEPAPVPDPSPTHGSYHWTFERLVSAGLVPLTIAPFAAGSLNPMTDAVLCGAILIHSHIGFEAVLIDYIPDKRLPKTRKAFMWALKLATVVVGVGLYEFETNDVGLTEAIKRVWKA
ncbi:Fumarate reductase respiratory complex transmembrane subunit [Glarea lozoyensis ATCC 20868]|uniref:Succinate dehydrogenase [ubiquinone] cytochrome b small subunit n=1 Tax=Glarea lozoyensis (strain ATCC 20868 / MF5171) TaxID=1116229 RepID=S3CDN2_GLAL2|nr:Fumarate reductase respiratory complex transmembrane subunit [Glarea lozoyensis ATCC 20868]EPE24632.1 Fumarate reductase respiratory complex transmembrane subunit [Glarea lozoyensis ATCC 20868]